MTNTAKLGYYVLVIAPMDSGFVGPFMTRNQAYDWAARQPHDWKVMTETEMLDNIAKYGEPDYITKS